MLGAPIRKKLTGCRENRILRVFASMNRLILLLMPPGCFMAFGQEALHTSSLTLGVGGLPYSDNPYYPDLQKGGPTFTGNYEYRLSQYLAVEGGTEILLPSGGGSFTQLASIPAGQNLTAYPAVPHWELEQFAEDMRKYLLGEMPFPGNMAVIVIVCSDAASRRLWTIPTQFVEAGCLNFAFDVRGIRFRVMMGHLPPFAQVANCRGPQRPIFLADCEMKTQQGWETPRPHRPRTRHGHSNQVQSVASKTRPLAV
jgi:hypothetical protein